jgi:hypothetical protein
MASLIFQEILKEVMPEQRANVRLSLALAERIHDLMDKNALNVEKMAKKMDEPIEVVETWMSGTHHFSVDTLIRLECFFDEPIIHVAASSGKIALAHAVEAA